MLYDNLVSNLTAVNNMKDKWPADVNDGYRVRLPCRACWRCTTLICRSCRRTVASDNR